MESENRQLSLMRDRLRMLLGTHLATLNHQTLVAAVGDVVIKQNALGRKGAAGANRGINKLSAAKQVARLR